MGMKTRKVLEVSDGNMQFVCIKTDEAMNQYRLYRVWWDAGHHRKLIEKYADMASVMCWLRDYAIMNR